MNGEYRMCSITKNWLGEATIRKIVENTFGQNQLSGYQALKGGFCNAVYRVILTDGRTVILKVAPAADIQLMSCEIAMMHTEAGAMQLAARNGIEGVPEVYAYDDTYQICNAKYLLMENKEGTPVNEVKESMTEMEKEQIDRKMGQRLRQIDSIEGERFGHFCVEELQRENWFKAFNLLMERIIRDGMDAGIDIGVSYEDILRKLQKHKDFFAEVTKPVLIHFDSWDGNFLMKDGRITGIIDWERAMWAEGLMEDRFRFHSRSEAFLTGYGKDTFSHAEQIRCWWYDIYLYLIMMFEVTYRQYETQDQYYWVHGLFEQVWEKLSRE